MFTCKKCSKVTNSFLTRFRAPNMAPDVMIIMGSKSDLAVGAKCVKVLQQLGVSNELHVASAHRTPAYVEELVKERGAKVFVGIAGVAAALPGVIAAMTTKPVIGVPVGGKVPFDSLLSIVQMPPGIPVATVGVDRGDNAGFLAAQILASSNPELGERIIAQRAKASEKVLQDDASLDVEMV
jgi:5-(carboxyamino)imidazole ribonucleotide mutase